MGEEIFAAGAEQPPARPLTPLIRGKTHGAAGILRFIVSIKISNLHADLLCHYKLSKIKIKKAAGRCGSGEGCGMKWR
jgi:hypothetical protein